VKDAPGIALIGTLDTKGPEIEYVRDRLRALGARPIVVDSGILGEPVDCVPDVSRAEVAREGGHELDVIRAAGSRGAAVELMEKGVRAVCLRLWLEGRLDGALCLGGAEGAILGAAAMRALPVGVPKVIVSPSASGRRAFAPTAGGAVAARARHAGRPVEGAGGASVGITMLGHTTPAVMRIRAALEQAGHEPVVFHANGVGGPAMERLAEQGALSGVVDYTLSELANSVMDGIHATGPERLRVAGRLGLPQVVVPGCVDFFNQGAPATVPERYRGRKRYYHNPVATLVRLETNEMVELGRAVAERLNEARGPVRVVAPTRGFSLADIDGGDLWHPEADAAFLEELAAGLRDDIPCELVDTHVNDPALADLVAERYLSLVPSPASA
jgi:uncharacterized protein (UPF0261 family)